MYNEYDENDNKSKLQEAGCLLSATLVALTIAECTGMTNIIEILTTDPNKITIEDLKNNFIKSCEKANRDEIFWLYPHDACQLYPIYTPLDAAKGMKAALEKSNNDKHNQFVKDFMERFWFADKLRNYFKCNNDNHELSEVLMDIIDKANWESTKDVVCERLVETLIIQEKAGMPLNEKENKWLATHVKANNYYHELKTNQPKKVAEQSEFVRFEVKGK